MSKDRTAYLGYGQKSHNEDNKEQRHVVKEDKTSFTLKVPAFTDRGATFIGWANVKLIKVNKEGLEAFRPKFSLANLKDLNRQIITDIRNNLARLFELKALKAKVIAGKATPAETAKVFAAEAKSNPALAKEAEALLRKIAQA